MRLHSFLSLKCEVAEKKGIKGVYATSQILKGELIALWGGIVYSKSEVEKLGADYPHFLTHPVSIYEGFYLGPINKTDLDDVEMFNHSCDPNAGIKGQIVLIARKKIYQGDQICFDYETSEINTETFECDCGSSICRKKIDGNSWKDPEFRKRNKGYFSWYIEEMIRKEC